MFLIQCGKNWLSFTAQTQFGKTWCNFALLAPLHLLTFIYILQATSKPEGLWLITNADAAVWCYRSACSSGRASLLASDLGILRFPGVFSKTVCVVNIPVLFVVARDWLISSKMLCRCQLCLQASKCVSRWFLELERCCVLLETLLEDSGAELPELAKVKGVCVIFGSRATHLHVDSTQLYCGTSWKSAP